MSAYPLEHIKKWAFIIVAILLIGMRASIVCQTQDNYQGTLVLDFRSCVPERNAISFSHGSTIYELKKERRKCRLKYGTEIEDPLWDGFLNTTCLIPKRMGRQKFIITSTGVDFSALVTYCKSVNRSEAKTP